MKRWLIVLALLATPAIADSDLPAARYANEQLSDPRQEAQAKALMEELRCLVCQGQSIADSDAELAGDMRAMVRERIAAGDTDLLRGPDAGYHSRYGCNGRHAPVAAVCRRFPAGGGAWIDGHHSG